MLPHSCVGNLEPVPAIRIIVLKTTRILSYLDQHAVNTLPSSDILLLASIWKHITSCGADPTPTLAVLRCAADQLCVTLSILPSHRGMSALIGMLVSKLSLDRGFSVTISILSSHRGLLYLYQYYPHTGGFLYLNQYYHFIGMHCKYLNTRLTLGPSCTCIDTTKGLLTYVNKPLILPVHRAVLLLKVCMYLHYPHPRAFLYLKVCMYQYYPHTGAFLHRYACIYTTLKQGPFCT